MDGASEINIIQFIFQFVGRLIQYAESNGNILNNFYTCILQQNMLFNVFFAKKIFIYILFPRLLVDFYIRTYL